MAYTADAGSASLAEVKAVYESAYKIVTALQPFHQGTNTPIDGNAGKETEAAMNTLLEALYDAVETVGTVSVPR